MNYVSRPGTALSITPRDQEWDAFDGQLQPEGQQLPPLVSESSILAHSISQNVGRQPLDGSSEILDRNPSSHPSPSGPLSMEAVGGVAAAGDGSSSYHRNQSCGHNFVEARAELAASAAATSDAIFRSQLQLNGEQVAYMRSNGRALEAALSAAVAAAIKAQAEDPASFIGQHILHKLRNGRNASDRNEEKLPSRPRSGIDEFAKLGDFSESSTTNAFRVGRRTRSKLFSKSSSSSNSMRSVAGVVKQEALSEGISQLEAEVKRLEREIEETKVRCH